jgi:hypothetical protein
MLTGSKNFQPSSMSKSHKMLQPAIRKAVPIYNNKNIVSFQDYILHYFVLSYGPPFFLLIIFFL